MRTEAERLRPSSPFTLGQKPRRKEMIVETHLDAKVGAFIRRDCALLGAEWLAF